jgi:hypothetical protein
MVGVSLNIGIRCKPPKLPVMEIPPAPRRIFGESNSRLVYFGFTFFYLRVLPDVG